MDLCVAENRALTPALECGGREKPGDRRERPLASGDLALRPALAGDSLPRPEAPGPTSPSPSPSEGAPLRLPRPPAAARGHEQ